MSNINDSASGGGSGTVTQITATSPLTGGVITTTGSIGLGTLSAGSNGLAASATTDATNAGNISTGLLAIARGGTNSATLIGAGLYTTTSPFFTLFNTTPVTVNAAAGGDQNLQTLTVPAGSVNTLGASFRIRASGVYTTGASGNGTMTYKIKFAGAAAVSLGPTTSAAINATSMPWCIDAMCTTTTTGASGVIHCDGVLSIIVPGTTSTSIGEIRMSIANSSAMDLTASFAVLVTVAGAGASANNTFTGNHLIIKSN